MRGRFPAGHIHAINAVQELRGALEVGPIVMLKHAIDAHTRAAILAASVAVGSNVDGDGMDQAFSL